MDGIISNFKDLTLNIIKSTEELEIQSNYDFARKMLRYDHNKAMNFAREAYNEEVDLENVFKSRNSLFSLIKKRQASFEIAKAKARISSQKSREIDSLFAMFDRFSL